MTRGSRRCSITRTAGSISRAVGSISRNRRCIPALDRAPLGVGGLAGREIDVERAPMV
jgi:hypothetical protein